MQIDLFNKLVKPILLYGCDILFLRSSSPNAMVYGETGVFPIRIDIETRMVKFWAHLVQPSKIKLSTKLYYAMYCLYDDLQNK